MQTEIKQLLENVQNGVISADEALLKLKTAPFEDLGFAKIDFHRSVRRGTPEVIYGAGKTPEQIAGIVNAMQKNGQNTVLITRLSPESADALSKEPAFRYFPEAKFGVIGEKPEPDGIGKIVVATGGTSDIPVAEEAALTAEYLGNRVTRLYDVGVAGLHRLLSHLDEIMSASVIVAISGMSS